jgi:hypothetical protein
VAEEDLAVQLREITASIEHEKTIQSQLGWLQLFRGQDLRRTLVGTGMLCLQQGQGISFTNNYLNITMLNLGFTNTYQLLVALYTGKWFITLFGFYLPDRIGRRPMVIFGAASMGTCMYIIAAVAAATNNKPTGALGNLTLASIFIWVVSGGSRFCIDLATAAHLVIAYVLSDLGCTSMDHRRRDQLAAAPCKDPGDGRMGRVRCWTHQQPRERCVAPSRMLATDLRRSCRTSRVPRTGICRGRSASSLALSPSSR